MGVGSNSQPVGVSSNSQPVGVGSNSQTSGCAQQMTENALKLASIAACHCEGHTNLIINAMVLYGRGIQWAGMSIAAYNAVHMYLKLDTVTTPSCCPAVIHLLETLHDAFACFSLLAACSHPHSREDGVSCGWSHSSTVRHC